MPVVMCKGTTIISSARPHCSPHEQLPQMWGGRRLQSALPPPTISPRSLYPLCIFERARAPFPVSLSMVGWMLGWWVASSVCVYVPSADGSSHEQSPYQTQDTTHPPQKSAHISVQQPKLTYLHPTPRRHREHARSRTTWTPVVISRSSSGPAMTLTAAWNR